MRVLGNADFKEKVVLLRADLNSDVKNKKVILSERIKESAKTINYLINKKARVIIISHQGNPGKEDFISLKQHCELLNKYSKVKFISDIIGENASREIGKMRDGEAILLENIRMETDEFDPDKKDNRIIEFFRNRIDCYVNDAFSVCHRKQTSMLIPRYIKTSSYAGLLLEKEVKALKNLRVKKCLYILGGAKPEDNIKLLKGNKVLACGLFAQCCLINKGVDFGYQNNYLKKQKAFIEIPLYKMQRVELPVDFAVKINGKRVEKKLKEFPNKYEIFDIGRATIEKYKREIKKAKAIYMKGPAGDAGERGFEKGTYEILKAIARSRAYSVIGGGHLSDAIAKSKINKKKFNHISLSGGALLNYIAGEKLVGLEALK